METAWGVIVMLIFASIGMMAMSNYTFVLGERAKKSIINGYKFAVALAILGAILLAALPFIYN